MQRRYDTLVVAGGATHAYFGHDEWAAFAPGMKTLEDARRLRNHILSAFEMAELSTDPAERAECLTFVVIGAGPTGVGVVGQVAELAQKCAAAGVSLDRHGAKATDGAASKPRRPVLGPFDEKLQRYTQLGCERWASRSGAAQRRSRWTTTASRSEKARRARSAFRARTKVWAAGVQASPLAKMLAGATGAETDRAGRIAVKPDCTLPGHPEVFAIGDMVSLNGLPGVAQPAMQEGKYVGKVIRARWMGTAPRAVQVLRQGQHGDHRPQRARWRTPSGR